MIISHDVKLPGRHRQPSLPGCQILLLTSIFITQWMPASGSARKTSAAAARNARQRSEESRTPGEKMRQGHRRRPASAPRRRTLRPGGRRRPRKGRAPALRSALHHRRPGHRPRLRCRRAFPNGAGKHDSAAPPVRIEKFDWARRARTWPRKPATTPREHETPRHWTICENMPNSLTTHVRNISPVPLPTTSTARVRPIRWRKDRLALVTSSSPVPTSCSTSLPMSRSRLTKKSRRPARLRRSRHPVTTIPVPSPPAARPVLP